MTSFAGGRILELLCGLGVLTGVRFWGGSGEASIGQKKRWYFRPLGYYEPWSLSWDGPPIAELSPGLRSFGGLLSRPLSSFASGGGILSFCAF